MSLPERFTIVSANILYDDRADSPAPAQSIRIPGLVELIASVDPDILCAYEVQPGNGEKLANELGLCAMGEIQYDRRGDHVMIATRFEDARFEPVLLDPKHKGYGMTMEIDDALFIALNPPWHPLLHMFRRTRQLRATAGMAADSDKDVFVNGDFNELDWWAGRRALLEAGLVSSVDESDMRRTRSYPTPYYAHLYNRIPDRVARHIPTAIDDIYHPPAFELVEFRLLGGPRTEPGEDADSPKRTQPGDESDHYFPAATFERRAA